MMYSKFNYFVLTTSSILHSSFLLVPREIFCIVFLLNSYMAERNKIHFPIMEVGKTTTANTEQFTQIHSLELFLLKLA